MPLDHERLIAALLDRTEQLRDIVRSADPATPLPTRPGWTLGGLVRRLADEQRWAAVIVATRAAEPPHDSLVRDLDRAGGQRPAELDEALADSSQGLARALRDAGPEAPMWTPLGPGTAAFFARRFAHETALGHADAALAVGRPWTLDPDLAVDALDEWLERLARASGPEARDLLGPGRTVHLHATDAPPGLDAEWVVDLSGSVPTWRRAHEKSAVAVRAPLAGLLLVVSGRQGLDAAGAMVFGEMALLEEWLAAGSAG